ncbi:TetR/AcrR family transcriptional regulator [Microbacterium sp.]|uniref:TetR/AcrR family transcriptional regulator n=1 Tax=Microbacterium sp. TaxID=51671 RepID=UPI003F9D2319
MNVESSAALNRDLIVDTALAIVREDGLQKVTMRAVGSRLGVTPMALYRHIGDREELSRLVVDRIGAAFELDCAGEAPWDEKATSWARVQRRGLRQYPGVAAWLMDNGPAGRNAYRVLDLLAEALTEAGFDNAQVARGATLIMSWTFSRVAIEDNADLRKAARRPNRSREFVSGLSDFDPDDYPAASRVGTELFTLSMEEIFDVGLQSIIHGLKHL